MTGHPNICGMLDFFEDGEFYYLVMPRAGAASSSVQDLFDYIEMYPTGLEPLTSISIFSQVAQAIFFLHEHGIVHRDIKDENIVLDGEGNVQVIDFGSAAYVKEGKKFDTFSGTLESVIPCSSDPADLSQFCCSRGAPRRALRREGDGHLGTRRAWLCDHLRFVRACPRMLC